MVGYYTSSALHSVASSPSLSSSSSVGGHPSLKPPPAGTRLTDVCVELGAVVEGVEDKRFPLVVCGEDLNQRDRLIYTSDVHRLTISLNAPNRDDVFLLQFEGF